MAEAERGAPREAAAGDVELVVDLIYAMLEEMVSYGGHTLRDEKTVGSLLRDRFTDSLRDDDHVYLLQPAASQATEPVGLIEASVVAPYAVFTPTRILQIHSLYVQPVHRGAGLGRQLAEAGLAWARERGCVEARLHVLAANPARALYERLGFDVVQLRMRREL